MGNFNIIQLLKAHKKSVGIVAVGLNMLMNLTDRLSKK